MSRLEDDLGMSPEDKNKAARLTSQLAAPEDPADWSVEAEGLQEQTFDKQQVIELASRELNFLAPLAVPESFTFKFPPLMLTIWQMLREMVQFKYGETPKLALGIPRGFAKTTLVKLFILYVILFTPRKFILITAKTATMAENILADVFDMLSHPNIIQLFGDWRIPAETNRNDLKKFGFRGRVIIVAALGAEGSVRGLNIKNSRPDVMIFDDIQSSKDAESQTISDGIERWMLGTAMKAKAPSGCLFIFCANMYPTDRSLLKKLRNDRTWTKFISGGILEDGSSLWPELRSIESLIAELDADIEAGHPEIFFSEVMNDTEAGVNAGFDFSALAPWSWLPEERPQGKFIIIDPAGDKPGSDDVAIGYFEVYDEVPAARMISSKRLSPGNTIREALLLALQTGTKLIAIESVAYQHTLLFWFEEVCKQLQITGIQCVDIYPGVKSKNYRISNMCKELSAGEIVLHPDVRSVVAHQIANWNPMKKQNQDDILDILTYAPKVLQTYGALAATEMHPAEFEAAGHGVVLDNHAF